MEKQRYAIIGSGALGGLYGAMLARAGFEVHFLLNSDYQHVAEAGFKIESHLGDFDLPDVHAHATADSLPECDVTIVGLKTTNNDLLPRLLSAPTRGGGVVLVLQNGLDTEADSAAVVGAERVLGGTCFLCSNKVGPGHIQHLDYGHIVFGDYRGDRKSVSQTAQRIANEMTIAGIEVETTPDLWKARWKKLLWNIPFNGLSVVLDASTQQLIEDADVERLVYEIMREIAAAACGNDAELTAHDIEEIVEKTRTMVPYDSSMRIDYAHGRPMEIESIVGDPLRAAKAVGISAPRIEMLYQQLKYCEKNRKH